MKFLDLNGLKVVLQKLLSKVATAFDNLDYRVENLEGNYLSKKDSAASAKKLDTDAGADNQPVYFENGIPVAIGHTIDSDVPENAKFTDTTYTDATTSQHGLMSVEDKKKLNGIADSANNYTHPTTSGNRHIPSGGSTGQFLKWSADGTAEWANDNNTTYAPATTSQDGLMSANDKKQLDNMPTELNKKLNTSQKGVAGGLAELDQTGRVPANQLPSFVDDVVEGYYYDSKFYKESTHGTVIDGEAGKIYVDLSSNKTYRWGGTAFTVISETIAIGNTATTAGRGDWTKRAYDHSQLAHAPANAQANQNAFSKVTVGDTTINSGNATDTLTLTAGKNVTLTPDTSGKKVTIASNDTTYGVVSSSANGLAPKSDGSTNKYLRADGSWQIPPNTDTKYNNFTGASASANGNAGLVPAPTMGNQDKYLKADGTWSTPTDTNTDTKVSQTVTTTTGNYPILLGSAGQTANTTQGAYFGKGITANPNTSTITATTFSGKATSAGTADTAAKVSNVLKFTGAVTDSYDGSATKSIAIPSVSDKKITITQGGSTKGSFTLNQSNDLTINLTDTNTDTKVTQTATTVAGEYPILLGSASQTTTQTQTTNFGTSIKANPNTGTITTNTLKAGGLETGGIIVHSSNTWDKDDQTTGLAVESFMVQNSRIDIYKRKGGDSNIKIPFNQDENIVIQQPVKVEGVNVNISTGDLNVNGSVTMESLHIKPNIDISSTNITLGQYSSVSFANENPGPFILRSNDSSVTIFSDGRIRTDSSSGYATYINNDQRLTINDSSVKIRASATDNLSLSADTGATLNYTDEIKLNSHNDISAINFAMADVVKWTLKTSVADALNGELWLNNGAGTSVINIAQDGTIKKLGTKTVGSATKPMYLNNGVPTACSYTLGKDVSASAKLTDTWTAFKGATSTTAGTAGYISTVPQAGQTALYFKSDGTWGTPTNTTYKDVTTTEHGLMTATDKSKLDGIQAKATAVSFSSSLSSGTKIGAITINGTSTNIYCQTNTDTHHAAYLYAGASSTATANAQAANGSLYLNLVENGTVRNSHKITGSGATSVTSDTSGNITISSTNTVYTHPTTAGNKHIPTGGSSGQLLGYSANGEAKWVEGFTAITDTEIGSMITEVFV